MDTYQYMIQNGTDFFSTGILPGGYRDIWSFGKTGDRDGVLAKTDPLVYIKGKRFKSTGNLRSDILKAIFEINMEGLT